MAARTRAGLRRRRMRDALGMATRARLRLRAVVWLVTVGALIVFRLRENWLVRVTALARRDRLLRERVGCVARGALRVIARERAFADEVSAFLLRVTTRATGIGGERGLVHLVAIEAAARAAVLGVRLIGVTRRRRARLRLQRRRLVRAMAVVARLIRVRADAFDMTLRVLVAAHAVLRFDRRIASEAVTALTRERARMQRRLHGAVALLADVRGWFSERALAVTVTARELLVADVYRVTGALANVAPLERHRRRRVRLATRATARNEHEDDRPPHRETPIG